jgi:YebC/PmpR family DNA-binding regulatory protein
MAGHSKWAKIKRAKAANDKQKSKIFTRLGKQITIAAKEGGGDPEMNFTLRLAIDKANQANMPKDNIERAIKRGTGELSGGEIERITYEAIVGDGIGILIDCSTDNTNRTFSEIKNMIESKGAKMGSAGSVSWQFQEKGRVELGVAKLKKSEKHGQDDKYVNDNLEDLEFDLIEIPGVEDYEVVDPADTTDFEESKDRPKDRKYVFVTTEKESLQKASEELDELGWQVLDSEIIKQPENTVNPDEKEREKLENIIEELEEHDDVDNIWTAVE